jgi:hypothetical protein
MRKIVDKIKSWSLSKRNREVFLVVIGLLLCAALVGLFLYNKNTDRQQREKVEKINSLNNESVSCDQVVSEIGNESPDGYDSSTKKMLLTQQMACYSKLENNDKALAAGEKLKALYASERDDYKVRMIELTMENIKSSSKAEESIKEYDTGQPVQ